MRTLARALTPALFLTLILAGPAFAQVGIGLKAGLNFADLKDVEHLDSIDSIHNETKTGYILGGHLAFPMSPSLKLQIEGLYSVKGATGQATGGLDVQKWENKLTYLEIPLLLKLEFPVPTLKPFLYGGASVSVLLSAQERVLADWHDIKDSLNSTDYGLVLGGGLHLGGLFCEVRYNHGLSDLVEEQDPHSMVTQSRNKVLSIMAGLEIF